MLGARLKELRLSKQLTQEQLSEVSEYAIRTISSWEADDRKPTIDTIIWLAKFYGVSSDYILGLTDNPARYELTINDSLPKDPQELAQALEPILEPIVRKIVGQMAKQDHEEQ